MKKQLIKVTLLLCVISLVIACSPKKEETATATVIDKEQIKKEIQVRENEYAEVYNSGEPKNIGYYADDAISFSQNKAPLVGRQAIVDYLKAGIDSSSKGIKISFVTNEVFPSTDGNQVVEIGYYKLVDSVEAVINTGNYMVLFENSKVARHNNNKEDKEHTAKQPTPKYI